MTANRCGCGFAGTCVTEDARCARCGLLVDDESLRWLVKNTLANFKRETLPDLSDCERLVEFWHTEDPGRLLDDAANEVLKALAVTAERDRLRVENKALKRSWNIDAEHRDQCYAALTAVWGDMRGVDKHHVQDEIIALVREAIGEDLDPHDPAFAPASDEDGAHR